LPARTTRYLRACRLPVIAAIASVRTLKSTGPNMRICGRHIVGLTLMLVTLAGCGGGDSDSASGGTNLPPIITGSPVTTLSAGSSYTFTPQAADPDGDPLRFSATNIPAWLTFNTSTGALAGTPTEANVGMSEMITIEVTDSRAVTQLPAFRINVTSNVTQPPGNTAPTIAGTPATSAFVGQVYNFAPVGFDADGDTLTYTIQNAPSWATFTASTGQLTGTPTSANVGTTSNIMIRVSDGRDEAALASFNLQVLATPPPANRPPTISGTPQTTVAAGSTYIFQPVASDPDGNTLRFTIQGQPSWATFSATTGRLTGTPSAANAGNTASITISVSDNVATVSLPSFIIAVSAPANRPPTITGTPLTSVVVGTAYSFQPSASDPDGNMLSFRIDNMPAWATFSTTTGRLAGTPGAANVGSTANVVISVSDGTNSVSLPAFTLAVLQAANGTATVTWTAPLTNTDGSTLTDLAGYRVSYGRSADNLDQLVEVNNPAVLSQQINDLATGQWFFGVQARNSIGAFSDYSNVVTKTIQ
jgi:hypothetical protein